ncbi:hypothetical protein [Variovorax guangxiensis]|uniref:Uncharacterized protein n=1 Tax=Variovorax guangxiensis TaxID=1775474 RepID=A0A840FXB1_9BURK|nr:hypothetical protein [Variovorax guangxiensis]MBB4224924.1 hypothetical protein [Variovorax guangxiensis]
MMASLRRADIEKSLLSRLFGHVIKLRVCTIGVEPQGSEPRTEAPDPAVLARFLGWFAEQTPQRQIIGMVAEYASLAGNRKNRIPGAFVATGRSQFRGNSCLPSQTARQEARAHR